MMRSVRDLSGSADTVRGEVDRHVSNLIVIIPIEEKEHDATGKPGECEAGAQT